MKRSLLRSARHRGVAPTFIVFALAALLVLAHASPAHADNPPGGPRPYDDGVVLSGAPNALPDDGVQAQFIQFFTDCAAGDLGGCGGPPGRWTRDRMPLVFCTFQTNRPATVTAQQVRDAVTAAAGMWNATNVAAGVSYTGDCATGTRWETNDGRNEIGFDDARRIIAGMTAGVSRGTWVNVPSFGAVQERRFTEFDVVLGSQLNVTDRCLRSIVAHEIGHTLGFGHSDDVNDLMYPTYNPNDPNGCRISASAAERTRLAELYGSNFPPSLSVDAPSNTSTGVLVSMTASATDPEGDAISYKWTQTGGSPVVISTNGATATFTSPDALGSTLQFQVTALDSYLHEATKDVSISVDAANTLPISVPSLQSFLVGSGGARLTWSAVANATSYQFCSDATCTAVSTPQAPISWNVILGSAGDPADRRIFTTGTRTTSVAACNSIGCSKPGAGPLAGGLTWAAWGIDFNYIAMAYDVPSAGVHFTIGGVVNQAGTARKFTIYSGSNDDPFATVVQNCGSVGAGGLCVGLLAPQQSGHGPLLTIVSELEGTPTTEQRITIR